VQDNISLISLLCSILHQPIWVGTCSDKFIGRLTILAGLKHRQLARQVGACCVLTNTFPLSSRWVAFSSLSSPGRRFASGVSSSCPATASQHGNNDGRRLARQRRTRRRLPPAVEEEHPGLPRYPPPPRRRRRGNRGYAGGGTSSVVGPEQVDDAGTPMGDMSGVVLAPETTTGVASQQRANPKRTDDASTLTKNLLGVSLVPEITVHSIPDATSPPSANQQVPSVFHPIPFRFSFDPPSDPTSVSVFVRAYPDLLGYHVWSTWDQLTTVSTSRPTGSEEEDDPDVSWDFSGLRDPGAMRDFMSACDHCLSGCSDNGHSLDDEGCDPTRECYHIDQEDHDGENHLSMPGSDGALAPASRVEIPRELAMVQVPTGVRTHSLSNSARCRPSSTKRQGGLCSSDKTSSMSGQAEHSPEGRVIGPRTSNAVSLMMPGQGCPRPSAGLART
jgi:hypothetical protein